MWVERLDIDGFRRLAGRFELRPALNLVLGENEAGKSTLHEALVRALFGFSKAERRGESAWRRCRPWDPGRPYRMRALVHEARGGRSYRIEWDFDTHAVRLLDAVTGVDESAQAAGKGKEVRLGEHLLGTDLNTFRGVCCLDQADITPVRRSDRLASALQQAVASVASDAGVEEADARLREYLSALGYRVDTYTPTPTGRAQALSAGRARLQEELARVTEERGRVRELASELARSEAGAVSLRGRVLAAELESARSRLQEARRLQREAEDRPASLPDLDLARVDWLRAQLDHVAAEIGQRKQEVEASRSQVAQLEARREELARRLEALAPYEGVDASAEAAVREAWAALQALSARGRAPEDERGDGGLAWRLLCVLTLGLASLLRRAWRAATRWIARRALAAAAARQRAEAEGRLAAALERAGAAEGPDLAARGAAYLAACEGQRERAAVAGELAQVEGERALAAEPQRALDRAREAQARLAQELDALCAAAGVVPEEVERLRDDAERARRAEAAAEALRALLGADTPAELGGRVAALEARLREHEREHGPAPAEPVADLEEGREELSRLGARISRLQGEIAEAERGLPAPAELEERLEEVEERLSRLELVRDAVELARETLAWAARETHRAFAPRLNEALGRALPRITGGRYREAFVADDLSLRVKAPETGAPVDPSQLSRATQDGIFLVQRLEIARLLDPTLGAAPLLLDDPFARFDRRRLRLGLELLAEIARDRQVIVFSEDPALDALAAEVCPGLHRIRLDPVA